MNIKIKNLGALDEAEFSLGDLTIICGNNNTGKTYATYALYGFLSFWQKNYIVDVNDEDINRLVDVGVLHIDLRKYIDNAEHILADSCRKYTKQLPTVFAAPADRFTDAEFCITIVHEDIRVMDQYHRRIRTTMPELYSVTKNKGSLDLVVTYLLEKEKIEFPHFVIMEFIGSAIKDIIFGNIFLIPFIASAERTGATIFRKESYFTRNRMLEVMLEETRTADNNVNDTLNYLLKNHQSYALPVEDNMDFMRRLEAIAKQRSFLVEQHPDILYDFADIIGGEYSVTPHDELYYAPRGKQIKLSMDEGSSAVRSLLIIGFYLRHMALPGDILMVDEPELNLHPENQRRMARLFARLINIGIKVFVTTHSDYIIKELNTLIMLNHDTPHLKRIAEQEGYRKEELISADQAKVYIAENVPVKTNEDQQEIRRQTLVLADIDPELGIEAPSFDTAIETMNRIQEEIVWGGE